ncbi:MAG TPA: heme NO-binding domain-containing protein [Solimonas sp.]|nr:heme NO-binding domain-containing protein [Solimonas sp.]
MVGLIQKLLIDLIDSVGGAEAVAEVRRRAQLPEDRRFRLDTVYPDDEWQRLLRATGEVLGKSQDELEIIYADYFGRDALRRWPVWFETSSSARQMLERQQTIHNTFATGVSDPAERRNISDKFRLEKLPHELVAHYRSPNQMCGLYRALAQWVLDHYQEQASIEETRCTKRGDAECEIHVRWPQGAEHA